MLTVCFGVPPESDAGDAGVIVVVATISTLAYCTPLLLLTPFVRSFRVCIDERASRVAVTRLELGSKGRRARSLPSSKKTRYVRTPFKSKTNTRQRAAVA